MENGRVETYIKRNPYANRIRLLGQVAEGQRYLHSQSPAVIHGGLTGANILVSGAGNVVIDFWLGRIEFAYNQLHNSTGWLNGRDPRWLAPELVGATTKEEARGTMSSNIFAFGRVMYQVFTSWTPFHSIPNSNAVTLLVAGGNNPERPIGLQDRTWRFMTECWNADPAGRPSAEEAVTHLSLLTLQGDFESKKES
ncbi:hypothetical protein BOTBODRAFT_539622 [Botryobasidium botryosum FD-172 SS1]|uniref:Protein kinase domain-containing protein n=1 Tax=Botryobasidium botryosum (strain FD-172 SS1) TaxID=930990 RepID=A0A067MAQ3_BOTB1|nr:hypothetical protein BOTBODRAFT_539622 [Botryobasidium botryosum FD-172 SS1]